MYNYHLALVSDKRGEILQNVKFDPTNRIEFVAESVGNLLKIDWFFIIIYRDKTLMQRGD